MANAEVLNPGTLWGAEGKPTISPQGWFNQVDTVATNPVGMKVRWGSIALRYVLMDPTSVNPVSGGPVYATTFTPSGTSSAVPVLTVTPDSDQSGANMGLQVMGVVGPFTYTVPTVKYYTWIQIAGVANVVSTGVTATSNILIGSSTDGQFAIIADGSNLTNIPAARVAGSSASGLIPALLMNMDW